MIECPNSSPPPRGVSHPRQELHLKTAAISKPIRRHGQKRGRLFEISNRQTDFSGKVLQQRLRLRAVESGPAHDALGDEMALRSGRRLFRTPVMQVTPGGSVQLVPLFGCRDTKVQQQG